MAITAAGYTTLLDIAKHNGSDPVVGLIDETIRLHPEITRGAARTIKGQSYKVWVRTVLPTATFRLANQGATVSKSIFTNRVVECFIFNPRFEIDKAVADKSEDGPAAYMGYEAKGIMEAAWQDLGRTFYYGRNQWTALLNGEQGLVPNNPLNAAAGSGTYGGDSLGFPGLVDGYNNTYQIDAQGTTANTASSVWGVKFGPQYVQWVYGENGEMALSDIMIQRIVDASSNPYTAYIQEILAYPGLQIGNLRGVGRIKNITADAGHTLTDAMMANLLALFPAGLSPDVWFMTRRSVTQLRNSRTAVNPTGMEAPIPTEVYGIPIEVTDSISNAEPINSTSLPY